MRSLNVVLLGSPGCGKGTLAKMLLKDYSLHLVTSSELLNSKTDYKIGATGKTVGDIMKAGGLVPDEIIFELMQLKLSKLGKTNILLDGFPRTRAQAARLDDIIDINYAYLIQVPKQTILDRISRRWIHPKSGRTYSYDFNPPKTHGLDDVTGEPLEIRMDDRPEVVLNRLQVYENAIEPVLEHYKINNKLRIFEGNDSPSIYKKIQAALTVDAGTNK